MVETAVWSQIEALYRARLPQFVRVASVIAGDRELTLESVQEGFADALRRAGQWGWPRSAGGLGLAVRS
ncbi:MAG: hypothetical protein ABI990_05005 [Actinomycetota bacterium]